MLQNLHESNYGPVKLAGALIGIGGIALEAAHLGHSSLDTPFGLGITSIGFSLWNGAHILSPESSSLQRRVSAVGLVTTILATGFANGMHAQNHQLADNIMFWSPVPTAVTALANPAVGFVERRIKG